MTLREEIDEYYEARKLGTPNATESILWLPSEIGELAEAYLNTTPDLPEDVVNALNYVIKAGQEAERAVVAMRESWVRNGERHQTRSDIASEAADSQMMLDRFLKAMGLDEPADCLRAKMRRKMGV